MKKIIPILLFISLPHIVFGQGRLDDPEMYLGVQGGALGSVVLFNPKVEGTGLQQTPITPTAGIMFRYAGHRVCAIQLELNYMQRALRQSLPQEGIDYYLALHYLELPVLMHLYFGSERGRFFINLGPQIGYAVSTTTRGTYKGEDWGKVRPFDYGVAFGLGGYYRSKNAGTYQLELRGNYSLGGIFGTKQVDYFTTANMMNFSINLAYLWEFRTP